MSEQRFKGVANLLGKEGMAKLQESCVCVVGLGGVGSWCVEALARSGVGSFVLVDFDDVCVTNINRQIQALESTLGQQKADLLRSRVLDINPACKVKILHSLFSGTTSEKIFSEGPFDCVVDCIDRVSAKALLLVECRTRKVPVISTGSAGDRTDPTKLTVKDMARTEYDNLLMKVRKKLRTEHDFPRSLRKTFGIPCVYAPEQYLPGKTAQKGSAECSTERRSCNSGLGSYLPVTGSMGFFAAAEVVKKLLA